ncbi:adhesion regulating molecule [Cristinia sonorae]|uniref:Adhesion regulating molecule n=1 Tax=Cristinia sonorae TaxID=1940300 RepID=A0A8K0UWS9_9AGAR|nr:adhesion regulating molecule [Cristinia sonorae]
MPEIRLAFKAGRAFRRDGTNFVDPSPTKGAVILQNGDDDLLHFQWKNRVTNEIEEDLILFPSDASFVKVSQSAWGRTFVLKFSSSDQRHFFWMQDADTNRDAEFVMNVNRLLADPSDDPVWLPSLGTSAGPNAASGSNTPADISPEQRDQITPRTHQASIPSLASRPPIPSLARNSSTDHCVTAVPCRGPQPRPSFQDWATRWPRSRFRITRRSRSQRRGVLESRPRTGRT